MNLSHSLHALVAVGEENVTFEKVKAMLLNDADRISDSKKVEDAYSAQQSRHRNGIESRERYNKEMMVNLFENLMVLVTTVRRKDTLL